MLRLIIFQLEQQGWSKKTARKRRKNSSNEKNKRKNL